MKIDGFAWGGAVFLYLEIGGGRERPQGAPAQPEPPGEAR